MSTETKAESVDSVSIVSGPPLSDEPGLGALTLPGFLHEVTELYGDREALVMHGADGVTRWTYSELWERAIDVARALRGLGLAKDGRVGVLMTNRQNGSRRSSAPPSRGASQSHSARSRPRRSSTTCSRPRVWRSCCSNATF